MALAEPLLCVLLPTAPSLLSLVLVALLASGALLSTLLLAPVVLPPVALVALALVVLLLVVLLLVVLLPNGPLLVPVTPVEAVIVSLVGLLSELPGLPTLAVSMLVVSESISARGSSCVLEQPTLVAAKLMTPTGSNPVRMKQVRADRYCSGRGAQRLG